MTAERDLLLGLLALQNGLISREQLVTAFALWTSSGGRPMGDVLADLNVLAAPQRVLLDALVEAHLKLHGGDPEKSLAALDINRSTRESLAAAGGPEVEATLGHVGSGSTEEGDHDRTATYAVGAETSNGQRFRVLRPYAKGGLGAVFVVLDGELNREVALKQILDHRADDPDSRQRFLVEAEITGGLEHPGIVPVYGLGSYDNGRPYYAMRFIRGDSLKEAIEHFHADASLKTDPGRRSLGLRKLLRRFTDVCDAIDYAHSRGVLHRDIKPGNVIVGKHGETLVVDWGLAKAQGRVGSPSTSEERTLIPASASGSAETLPGQALGTPAYMSPEQACGDLEALGPRSDVYSLGATLYSLMTGKPPFEGDDVGAVLRKVERGEFVPPRRLDPSIDRPLEAVCLKAMATRPEQRYASCRALADDVERWLADEPVLAAPDPLRKRAARWARRHKPAMAAVSTLFLASITALTVGFFLVKLERDQTELARAEAQKNYLRAENQKARAQENFLKAREAVDKMLSSVAEHGLREVPQMEKLRRVLFEEALRFNEGFLREQGDDPDLRRETAAAHRRAAEIHEQLGQDEQAESDYGRSISLFKSLADHSPGPRVYRADLAHAYDRRGNLHSRLHRFPQAEKDFGSALTLQQVLVDSATDDLGSQIQFGAILVDRGLALTNMGRHSDAAAVLRQAISRLEPLVNRDDPGAQTLRNLARSHQTLAILLGDIGRDDESEQAGRRALRWIERLVARFPDNPVDRSSLSGALTNLGTRLTVIGQEAEAEIMHRRALKVQEKLAEDFPDTPRYRYMVAAMRQNLGLALASLKRFRDAQTEYREAARICEDLARRWPKVPEYRDVWCFATHSLAISLADDGRIEDAETEYRKALEIGGRLVADFPDTPMYRETLGHADNNLANLLDGLGRFDAAVAAYRQSLLVWEVLTKNYPEVPEYHSHYGSAMANMADTLIKLKRLDEARALADQAVIQHELAFKKNPQRPEYQQALCTARFVVAHIQAQAGDYLKAAEAAEAVLQSYPTLEQNPIEAAGVLVACALKVIEDLKLSDSDRRALANRYEAQAVAVLSKARSNGTINTPRLLRSIAEGDNFKPLRPRPDFQLLLMDIAMPTDPFARAD